MGAIKIINQIFNTLKIMSATNVITGLVRFSYPAVFAPKAIGEKGDLKYSVSIIIPKSDKETLKKIEAAIDAAFQAGKAILGTTKDKLPASMKTPLRDGDDREDEDATYKNSYYVTANGNRKPGLIDINKKDITDPDDFYPGCYGRASINFYAFAVPGNKGIACGLNNLQKIKDGDRLDGRKDAASDFDDEFTDNYIEDEVAGAHDNPDEDWDT